MAFVSRRMGLSTGGSDSPVRRLLVYYLFLVLLAVVLVKVFPPANVMFSGERMGDPTSVPQLLTDGLSGGSAVALIEETDLAPRMQAILTAVIVMIGALFLMLPVS
jgi:hypothetical protein